MEEKHTTITNTEIDPPAFKPRLKLIDPNADHPYLLDGRYLIDIIRKGIWGKDDRGGVEYTAVCSECGWSTPWSDRSNFCPECGAPMENPAWID